MYSVKNNVLTVCLKLKERILSQKLFFVRRCGTRDFGIVLKNKLPGNPDIVYPSLKVVIFVDGCFWHKCPKHYQPPKTRVSFWKNKINGNVERDKKNNILLQSKGWLVIRVWEHEIKNSLSTCAYRISGALSQRKSKSHLATD